MLYAHTASPVHPDKAPTMQRNMRGHEQWSVQKKEKIEVLRTERTKVWGTIPRDQLKGRYKYFLRFDLAGCYTDKGG